MNICMREQRRERVDDKETIILYISKGKVHEMMKKVRIAVITLFIIVIVVGGIIWETTEIRQYAGEYVAVDVQDSTYVLSLSKTGRISVIDVGAGNPAIEGWIYRTPFSAVYSRYYLKSGGETDSAFLDLGENNGKAVVWLFELGRAVADDEEPTPFSVITIETGTDQMQFNEKGFE